MPSSEETAPATNNIDLICRLSLRAGVTAGVAEVPPNGAPRWFDRSSVARRVTVRRVDRGPERGLRFAGFPIDAAFTQPEASEEILEPNQNGTPHPATAGTSQSAQ